MGRTEPTPGQREGILGPRWLVAAGGALALFWVGLSILKPPAWVVQRLDSPDGRHAARLLRTRYVATENLVVRIKDGWVWRTVYFSPTLEADYRVDLGERLFWSEDSRRLSLRMGGRVVWSYDAEARRTQPVPGP